MPKYDTVLKLVLHQSGTGLVRVLVDQSLAAWHKVELPHISTQFADLLVETTSGRLCHIELQSSNDPDMPLRMLEYALRVYRKFGRFPEQTVLYVGRAPMRMPAELVSDNLRFGYRLIDVRDLDSETLFASDSVGDNIVGILARLRDSREAVRRVLNAIGALERPDRDVALESLMILASLRNLEEMVRRRQSECRNSTTSWKTRCLGVSTRGAN